MISTELAIFLILICCFLGLTWAIINAVFLARIKLLGGAAISESYNKFHDEEYHPDHRVHLLLEVASYIEKGANAFLFAEYKYIGMFVVVLAFVIFFAVEEHLGYLWTTVSFLLGCVTSILSGYIGMKVAVFSNYRCAYRATTSMSSAFSVAYRAGTVMGFALTSIGLLVLTLLIVFYTNYYVVDYSDYTSMFECVAGYGLGGSTIALFGRVGGGIFTKAADVGADLVGKVEQDFAEDSPNNPATIADNVGDNVGDIAGMGADLFGSFAESTSAALVVAGNSPTFYYQPTGFYYPLLISAFGIIVCIVTTTFATGKKTESFKAVSDTLKGQLIISTILMTPALWYAGYLTLPDRLYGLGDVDREPIDAFYCGLTGLWSGLVIGYITEYYTSHSYKPVQEVAAACETGAATNIIYGLALGNWSTIIPVFMLSITAYVSHTLLGMFGVALAALGMLSTLAVGLAIDAYGPVSDNAGGIAEMCELGEEVRSRTDALDAAGNTTAAIGKGFAIGSAALVALSLYGAFITRAARFTNIHPVNSVNINVPLIFSGLLVGAMAPYAFSALCMKSVGKAALEMVKDIRLQLEENPGIRTGQSKPNYERCIVIATKTSLNEMFAPGIIVIGLPLVAGILFGNTCVAGILPGIIISGVSMAVASANSGGAWDNAKKYIESGNFTVDGQVR